MWVLSAICCRRERERVTTIESRAVRSRATALLHASRAGLAIRSASVRHRSPSPRSLEAHQAARPKVSPFDLKEAKGRMRHASPRQALAARAPPSPTRPNLSPSRHGSLRLDVQREGMNKGPLQPATIMEEQELLAVEPLRTQSGEPLAPSLSSGSGCSAGDGPIMTSTRTLPATSVAQDEYRDRQAVEAFEALAARLECECQKYPKSGGGMFTNPQSRYLAAMARDDVWVASQESWQMRLRYWRKGKLVYWKDRQSYLRKEKPKGSLDLLSISKVIWEQEEPQNVTVRHVAGGDKFDLVLKFSAEGIAKEWKEALLQMRRLVSQANLGYIKPEDIMLS